MSSRHALTPSVYRSHVQRWRIQSPCSSLHPHSLFAQIQWQQKQFPITHLSIRTRGKKTKTTIKFTDLPQGALPPLPAEDEHRDPPKGPSTVLQQHLDNVKKYHDCIVLTRVGDFYEMYYDQVDEYAPLVGLKKAKRSTSLGDVAMAGFQYTQLERYLKMFVLDLGKAVAISEQVRIPENERLARGGNGPFFDRKVNRVVTAGTLVDESFLNAYENNYLLSVALGDATLSVLDAAKDGRAILKSSGDCKIGLSWVDLSNGDFYTQTSDLASLPTLIARINPQEVVLDSVLESIEHSQLSKIFGEGVYSIHFHKDKSTFSSVTEWTPMLERAVDEDEASKFTTLEVTAGNLVLDYVSGKLIDLKVQLQPPVQRRDDEYMSIDKQTLKSLEIRSTLRDGHFQGSLLHSVRKTVTQSGARLLGQRLVSPSLSCSVIAQRLDLVEEMLYQESLREDIVMLLKRTSDTLRLVQRFSIGKGDADDLVGLARTIDIMAHVSKALRRRCEAIDDVSSEMPAQRSTRESLERLLSRLELDGPIKVAKAIVTAIDEEGLGRQHDAEDEARAAAEEMTAEVEKADASGEKAPRLGRKGSAAKSALVSDAIEEDIWIMRKHASPTLEKAHDHFATLFEAKAELAQRLRTLLHADSLTLRCTGGLGYHCHVKGKDRRVSLESLEGARETGSSKSTKTFYYHDWTQLGARINDAKQRIRHEEEQVFHKLREHVIQNIMKLRRNAMVLDELDVACSSATIAQERQLVRPVITTRLSHKIIGGRHPTVDVGLHSQGRQFTANDCLVGDSERIYLITGPNMAGKSTYLRQNALITILAQTGCFVPATFAEIGLVDQIFSRVGSADALYQDQSTFMVEMLETAAILRQATPRSLVIMDEVGRGTTPEDGLAVAYATLHHLYHVNRSRALFATHFHALAPLTRDFDRLACFCTDVVEEEDGRWSYAHRLRKGVNWRSHALKVAEMAGMPHSAITVAQEILNDLPSAKAQGVEGTLSELVAAREAG